jgi:hypothetical protein
MAHQSDPHFRVLHALRIKGFVSCEAVTELVGLPENDVEDLLFGMQDSGLAQFKEARNIWSLTKDGREAHPLALQADASRPGFREGLGASYHEFLEHNESFKALCGDWQLRNGEPNDHSDPAYDKPVIARLHTLNDGAQKICTSIGEVAERFADYGPRLNRSLTALNGGNVKMFTGVMCNSYHDVWMELHEDLILTQGIDRVAEGSF